MTDCIDVGLAFIVIYEYSPMLYLDLLLDLLLDLELVLLPREVVLSNDLFSGFGGSLSS